MKTFRTYSFAQRWQQARCTTVISENLHRVRPRSEKKAGRKVRTMALFSASMRHSKAWLNGSISHIYGLLRKCQ